MDSLIRKIRPQVLAWLHRSRSGQVSSFLRKLSYKEIEKATDGFHRIIYSSSHGTAYKARLRDGQIVMVKDIAGFSEDKDAFYSEVQLLDRLHHRHLLAVRGFCRGRRRLLVFDDIENGSLKEHLNDPLRTPLNWRTRLKIAIGVAAALEYLLLFSNPPSYHVSVSSSNVMLDENFNAKLSDIGIISPAESSRLPHDSHREEDSTDQKCRHIIFQLGVLILELVTGQSSEKGSTDLIQWIQESRVSISVQNMIDPDLGNNYDSKELRNLLSVARLCIKSGDKPKFSVPQIFRYLQKKVDPSCDCD